MGSAEGGFNTNSGQIAVDSRAILLGAPARMAGLYVLASTLLTPESFMLSAEFDLLMPACRGRRAEICR
jgi:hypothetical protein